MICKIVWKDFGNIWWRIPTWSTQHLFTLVWLTMITVLQFWHWCVLVSSVESNEILLLVDCRWLYWLPAQFIDSKVNAWICDHRTWLQEAIFHLRFCSFTATSFFEGFRKFRFAYGRYVCVAKDFSSSTLFEWTTSHIIWTFININNYRFT